jgi:simple sugar transport system substrate-binding protein/ribose transport system substrate-binding protein
VSGWSSSSGAKNGGKGASLVGVDYPRSDSDFWNAYVRYVPQQAGPLGVDLKTTNSQNDIARLQSNVQTLVAQGVKGVVIAPQDTAAVFPTLQQLESKKIPVVSVDTRPDKGKVYMVVRADNKAYGEKACKYIGDSLKGVGNVVMFEGDLGSINGRDRSEAFAGCMKQNYPSMKVFAEPTKWDPQTAVGQLQTVLAGNKVHAIYMEASIYLPSTVQVLQQKGLLKKHGEAGHIVIVSNDGVPSEYKAIKDGVMDATLSQPADLYAKYALSYLKDAIAGKTYQPGKTDHDSTIIDIGNGNLEDQLPAPIVTADGSYPGSLKVDDKSLWGNQIG